jgi:hypothetical protein
MHSYVGCPKAVSGICVCFYAGYPVHSYFGCSMHFCLDCLLHLQYVSDAWGDPITDASSICVWEVLAFLCWAPCAFLYRVYNEFVSGIL